MKLRTLFALSSVAICALAPAQYAGARAVPGDLRAGFDSIKVSDLKEWLGYLAGPECEGRGAGSVGYMKAADYMAKHFKEYGLKPVGDEGTYFQYVRSSGEIAEGTGLTLGSQKIVLGPDFNVSGVKGATSIEGDVVYLKASGTDAKVPAGVAGKVVVAKLEGVPIAFRRELMASAKLVIEVSELIPESRNFNSSQGGLGLRGRLSEAEEAKFLKANNVTPTGDLFLTSTLTKGKLDVKVGKVTKSDPNVVGLLEGSDPTLKAEVVGIGGHLDHMGKRGDVVYWGADDDASGCSALLAIAKAMHVNKVKPKRSILFMAFSMEESGLVGSRFLADNPPIPLSKMICELQMDMVGRNSDGAQNGDQNRIDVASENTDTIRLVGSQRISTHLHNLILEQNRFVNFRFKYDAEDVYTRSDHYSFAAKGVPVAFVFSGFHPDYHQPTDTIEKINFEKVANAAKLFYLVAMHAADRESHFPKDVAQGGNR